jgi:hypothetical protein
VLSKLIIASVAIGIGVMSGAFAATIRRVAGVVVVDAPPSMPDTLSKAFAKSVSGRTSSSPMTSTFGINVMQWNRVCVLIKKSERCCGLRGWG